MAKYLYSGPLSGVSLAPLKEGDKSKDVRLVPGAVVELPEEHPYVKTLVALGHLAKPPAKEPAPAPTKEPKTSRKGS